MANNEMFFAVYSDEGKEVECEILFTTERNGVNYIVYTDNTVNDDGDFRVYANIYDPTAEDQPYSLLQPKRSGISSDSYLPNFRKSAKSNSAPKNNLNR